MPRRARRPRPASHSGHEPGRTILDLADVLGERDLARAVDEAQVRGLARHAELLAAVERAGNGHRGGVLLAQILHEDGPSLTRSEAEDRVISLVARAGLPRPEVNVRVGGYEVDLLWRRARLVVEVDGYAFHSTRAAFERDRVRDAELLAIGLRVLRITWRQIADEPYAIVARIARTLV